VSGLPIDAHDVTDYVCRMADGSMGRVAIIAGTDDEWMALCAQVKPLDRPDADADG
jgi:hypothetical protein